MFRPSRLFAVLASAALVLTSSGAPSALAAAPAPAATAAPPAPKPPTDATRWAYGPKSGVLKYTDAAEGSITIGAKVKDFDVLLNLTNPVTGTWWYAFDFRLTSQGAGYALTLDSHGEYRFSLYTAGGGIQPLKANTPTTALRARPLQGNDIALYVRGAQALLFINRLYVDTFDVSAVNDVGDIEFAVGSIQSSGEVRYRNFGVKTPAGAAPVSSTPSAQKDGTPGVISMSLYRSGYSQFGRPAGMDDRARGCGGFDDKRPVWQFQAVMKITNRSQQPMKVWYPFFIKPGGSYAYTCYYEYLPEIPPGESRDVTFGAFVELNESIAGIVILDKDLGRSSVLPVPPR
jgi:hypothetical protein